MLAEYKIFETNQFLKDLGEDFSGQQERVTELARFLNLAPGGEQEDEDDFSEVVFRMKPVSRGTIHARLVYAGPAKPRLFADDFDLDE